MVKMLQFPRDMSSGNTVSNSLSSVVNTFYIYIYICVCVCVCVCVNMYLVLTLQLQLI